MPLEKYTHEGAVPRLFSGRSGETVITFTIRVIVEARNVRRHGTRSSSIACPTAALEHTADLGAHTHTKSGNRNKLQQQPVTSVGLVQMPRSLAACRCGNMTRSGVMVVGCATVRSREAESTAAD
jgi:hypothetical protein